MTLAEIIECFNYPHEQGEDPLESFMDLSREARDGSDEGLRAVAAALRDELGRTIDAIEGGGEGSPYVEARAQGEDVELYHSGREAWVTLADLDAQRPTPAKDRSERTRQLVALLEAFAPQPEETHPEKRFEEETQERLTHALQELFEDGRHDVVEACCARVLATRPRFPGQFWGLLARSRLERGALDDDTRLAVGRGLFYMNGWEPTHAELLYRWHEATGADRETLALVYYGLAQYCRKLTNVARRPGAKPAKLKSRFGAIFAEWIEAAWPGVEAFDDGELLHLKVMFDELAKRPLKARTAEIAARLTELTG